MRKIFIFYFEWRNTANNHCGMAYFSRCLKKNLELDVELIKTPRGYASWRERVRRLWREFIVFYLVLKHHPKDIYLFMEFLNPNKAPGDYCEIASVLRARGVNNKFLGLVHLPPSVLIEYLGEEYLHREVAKVDRLIVMGSNLAEYFNKIGYGEKTNLTFYYADTQYYYPARKTVNKGDFIIFVSGYLYRNYNLLKEIVRRCPDVTFDLCLGLKSLDPELIKNRNITLNKFLPETEYLRKMQISDVSLSVFDDTVGSNVITTSLACGLPQIVSDVGAIRDYCSENNAIFCKTTDDYVNAIQLLNRNREKCLEMGIHARRKAEEISLEKSLNWYKHLLNSL